MFLTPWDLVLEAGTGVADAEGLPDDEPLAPAGRSVSGLRGRVASKDQLAAARMDCARARISSARKRRSAQLRLGVAMKKILELLLCILHPVAVVLIWINLALRHDLGLIAKLTWAIAAIVPFVPFVYVLTGNDFI
jgi:hypothetical protein